MDTTLLTTIARLRAAVGFLGERSDPPWWPSSFYTPGSSSFLTPLFPRTATLDQTLGVSQAAALRHDERIGIGHVYHLFRLPEALERALHHALQEPALATTVAELGATREQMLEALQQSAVPLERTGIGPTRIGTIEALHEAEAWERAAAQYRYAFEHGIEVYPYFSDAAG